MVFGSNSSRANLATTGRCILSLPVLLYFSFETVLTECASTLANIAYTVVS